jgi:hypothetical protein
MNFVLCVIDQFSGGLGLGNADIGYGGIDGRDVGGDFGE